MIIDCDQEGITPSMQGWFNIQKSIPVIYPNQWAREENMYENIVGAENKFDKVQFPFAIKPQ